MLCYEPLCYIALHCVILHYLFSCNLLWLDAFHYTNSFNHKLYAWRGALKSSNLLQTQQEKFILLVEPAEVINTFVWFILYLHNIRFCSKI